MRLIYHNRKGIAACQENLSIGAFRARRGFVSRRRRIVNPCHSRVQKPPIEWHADCSRYSRIAAISRYKSG
jgi:hypothetical protein